MKLALISASIALSFATPAFSHTPSTWPDLEIFISGSSAEQKILGKTVTSMMAGGSIHVYTDGNTDLAYFGTVAGTGSALDGKKVLVHSTKKGGSWVGVGPVARAQEIPRMKIDNACMSTGSGYPAASYTCLGTQSAVPDAGGSDLEPARFIGINVPTMDSELTSEELSYLSVACQFALVYGVATSKTGLAGLSRSQINSLLTGTIKNWTSIPGAGNGPVTICRRVAGSGVQAAFNRFFEDYGCCSSAQIPSVASSSNPGVYEVIENSSSEAVAMCMNSHSGAIGVLSLETIPSGNWHFANLDGVAPTVLNAANGLYDFYYEGTFQWRTDTVNGIAPPTGDTLDFLQTYFNRSVEPSILSSLPGFAALPSYFNPTHYPAGQVMHGTRQCDSCAPSQLFY